MRRQIIDTQKTKVLFIIIILFLLTSCSESDQSSVEVESNGTVSIGFSAGFTGDMGPWAEPMHQAAMLALEEINDAGGILGNQVELYTEDNKSVVEGSVQAANKLVNVNNVSAIIGPESDPIMALLDFAKENQVPIISTSGGTTGLDQAGGKGRYIYRTNPSDSFIGVLEAKVALEELGFNTLVVIHENTEGSTSAAESIADNFERFGGEVLNMVALSSGQSTYASELRTAFSEMPDFFYLSAGQITAITLLKERYQLNYGGEIMGSTEIQTPEIVAGAGEASYGLFTATIVEQEDSKGWERFSRLFEQKWGEKPLAGNYVSNTYDAMILVALAMEAAGGTTGEDVDMFLTEVSSPPGVKVYSFAEGVEELRNGNEIDYEGASGPVDFNEYGNVTAPAVAIMRVDGNGEWIIEQVIDTSGYPTN